MKSLKKISRKKGYKFIPRAYVCNEGGTNHKRICMVFGDDYCKDHVFGCQFHFMNEMLKNKHDVGEDLRETFFELCQKLVKEATNVTKYILKGMIDEIAKKYPAISRSIDWWHERWCKIFKPFCRGCLQGVT